MILPLTSMADCRKIKHTLRGEVPVVCLWATGLPRQTVDIMVKIYDLLKDKDVVPLLLLRESAIDYFHVCYEKRDDLSVFLCEDKYIINYLKIDLLMTHDYTCDYKGGFNCKVLLLQHSSEVRYLRKTDQWADYLIISSPHDIDRYKTYKYDFYPNETKIGQRSSLVLIPAGYAKFDILTDAYQKFFDAKHKKISYFPTYELRILSHVSFEELVYTEYKLIDAILKDFPDFTFVIHLYPRDRGSRHMKALLERYGNHPRFIYDDSDDNVFHLITSSILIIAYSSVKINYFFTTLKPCIDLRINDTFFKNNIQKTVYGYDVKTADDALTSLRILLNNKDQWHESILQQRNLQFAHFGQTCKYIADNILCILNDTPLPDWTVIDKKNTIYRCFGIFKSIF